MGSIRLRRLAIRIESDALALSLLAYPHAHLILKQVQIYEHAGSVTWLRSYFQHFVAKPSICGFLGVLICVEISPLETISRDDHE